VHQPIVFTSANFNSGNLGTAATCPPDRREHQRRQLRQLRDGPHLPINDSLVSCTGGNWSSLPAKRNGGYCFQATAGDFPWAFSSRSDVGSSKGEGPRPWGGEATPGSSLRIDPTGSRPKAIQGGYLLASAR
jgi:hypothetical protein